ncbi:MAG: VTT domain-containing protein [Elusimicrobia bacterium]|nr:VTT domain-containing protein [Elusimicrobiota bacterium]
MIGEITQWILELLRTHGSVSVFIGVIIESVIVPIPSPVIIMGAGAILIPVNISCGQAFWDIARFIVLPGTLASTLGAFIGYGIGYWGGKPVIDRIEKFLGFGWKDIEAMERRWTGRKIGLSIFFLRAMPIIPLSLISAAAGVIRLPAAGFTLWTFLGSIPRCFFLGWLGWLMKDAYFAMAKKLNSVESAVSALLVLGAAGVVLWLRARMRAGT